MAELPQNFADRFGWEAGAIDFFGPEYGLPKAISGHNNYYLWGPGDCTGEVVISVGVPLERLEAVFGDIERVDIVTCEYCMMGVVGVPWDHQVVKR